ncbi:hypothetical protein DRV85_10500 [Rhodosalinus halophilus]|jgi:hypothetical protein|uniref:Cytochrome b/b6 C-terminal region profile domain-containing protein n=1 Tax=Rhodosalinus halophilus TaxID=2259333 RepID=A0A365U8C1_9RHOB|nr:hypothetical protein [Rhodosalinus halophilus]RBI85079.1 hypothetical protein DRV85_10500 [Rhodosalinus halophilus]
MLPMQWFLRMYRWARHPPSKAFRWTVGVVLVLAAIIVGLEAWLGTPEWMEVNPRPRGVPMMP